MRIIPAIDIIGGKCVRLEKGDFAKKKIYADDPVEMAKVFQDHGIKYLHLVDLDGAKEGMLKNQNILERIKSSTQLQVDYGGGVRSTQDIESLLNAGADQVNIGSLSVTKPMRIYEMLDKFPKEIIILSPDVIDKKIAIHGWQEASEIDLFEYLQGYIEKGVQYFVCTDIEKDGMLTGSSIDLYKEIMEKHDEINLIASGGVKDTSDLEELIKIKVDGVIIGKAIYEGRIKLNELESYVS